VKIHNCAGYIHCQYCQDIEGLQARVKELEEENDRLRKVVEMARELHANHDGTAYILAGLAKVGLALRELGGAGLKK
jgi:hypothetical protein